MKTIDSKVISRIYGNGRGWAFSKKDFSDLGLDSTIRQILSRLEQKKTIRRIYRGVYDYPSYSKLLQKEISPDFDMAAKAIARKFGWTIQVAGAAALNVLGVSTQVPAKIIYLSDGPTKTIDIAPWEIHFRKAPLKEVKLKPKTSLMIQAIKFQGKDHFDNKVIQDFSKAFSIKEKNIILKDAVGATDWVYELIKIICKD